MIFTVEFKEDIDLQVSNLKVNPTSINDGDEVTVSAKLYNHGTVDAKGVLFIRLDEENVHYEEIDLPRAKTVSFSAKPDDWRAFGFKEEHHTLSVEIVPTDDYKHLEPRGDSNNSQDVEIKIKKKDEEFIDLAVDENLEISKIDPKTNRASQA